MSLSSKPGLPTGPSHAPATASLVWARRRARGSLPWTTLRASHEPDFAGAEA